jgi:hypothetical protein
MDALDRTFQHLINTIQARYPAYLTQPFDVAELYQNILPYRHHRRELGLETNQDYELVLLQLLSGARDYFIVQQEMRDRLGRELTLPNPDPGAFREFSTAQIALSPAAVRRFQSGSAAAAVAAEPVLAGTSQSSATDITQRVSTIPRTSTQPPSSTSPKSAASSSSATAPSLVAQAAPRRAPITTTASTGPRAAAIPATTRGMQTIVPQSGEQCRYCNGVLPTGKRITFCPHCGQNLTVVNCMACGTELELGWKFCTTCGRPVSQS